MKKLIAILVFFTFLLSLQAAEKITRLGQHPFYKTQNLKPEDLKKIADKRPGDIKKGLEEAGMGELFYAFMEQIQKADIQTTTIQPGDQLMWMLYKEGKQIKVKKDIVWAGKTSIKAYTFKIFREGKFYEFVIPKICANISLKAIEEGPVPICAIKLSADKVEVGTPLKIDTCDSKNAVKTTVTVKDAEGNVIKVMELTPENCIGEMVFTKTGNYLIDAVTEGEYGMQSKCEVETTALAYTNTPPVCQLAITPKKGLGGKEIKLDASASNDPDGKVVAAIFEIKDAKGNVIETKTIDQEPFIYSFKTSGVGKYSVVVVTKDNGENGGKTSEGCAGSFSVAKPGHIIADLAFFYMKDPTNFLALRLGYQHKFSESVRLNAMGGVFFNLSNNSVGTPFVLDLTLGFYPSRFWIAGGVGMWFAKNDNKLDLIGNVGYEIFSSDSVSGSLFLELRIAPKDFDNFSDMARWGIGFRLSI